MFSNGTAEADVDHYSLINTTNELYVVHKEYPRHYTLGKAVYFRINGTTKAERTANYMEAKKGMKVY
jgi:hypothetical protein